MASQVATSFETSHEWGEEGYRKRSVCPHNHEVTCTTIYQLETYGLMLGEIGDKTANRNGTRSSNISHSVYAVPATNTIEGPTPRSGVGLFSCVG